MTNRCAWAGADPLMQAYHDTEWGAPERDSRALWEKLVLDGFQAGLAWITNQRKRDSSSARAAASKSSGRGDIPEIGGAFVSVQLTRPEDATPAELIGAPAHVSNGRDNDGMHPLVETRNL